MAFTIPSRILNLTLCFVFLTFIRALWICISVRSLPYSRTQLEIVVDNDISSGNLVNPEADSLDKFPQVTKEIGRSNKLSSEIKGFAVISTTESKSIYPDLNYQIEFQTSQLAILDGRAYASRKVLYRSEAKPIAVIVVALDANWDSDILNIILEERRTFCAKHNYGLFARYIQDFAAEARPSWMSLGLAPIRMLRQSMLAFPCTDWFWFFSADGHLRSFNMPILPLMNDKRDSLQFAMDTWYTDTKTQTFASEADKATIILSVDPRTPHHISAHSIMLRRSLSASMFLEVLSDPVIQEYEDFTKVRDQASNAITHLVKWHPCLASQIAMISPEWSGNQFCEDTLDELTACTLSSPESWRLVSLHSKQEFKLDIS